MDPTSRSSARQDDPLAATYPHHPINVVMIPSATGGLGHVGRTSKLALALKRADPSLRISYVLDEHRLRPMNTEVVARLGYPFRILPDRPRSERDEAVRAVLGDADVVIDDTHRRQIPYRRILPRLKAWISVPMPPLWDELFMDWPLFEHVDAILYSYPEVMPPPEELALFPDKLRVTGPMLDEVAVSSREEAKRRLGLDPACRYITASPRGFPFGDQFGRRLLNGIVGGFIQLHRQAPDLRLVLLAVPDAAAVQPPRVPTLTEIEGVTVLGVLSPEEARDYTVAADLAIVEATTSLFDAALARTPVVMVPGPIYETWLHGTWVNEHDAGVVLWIESVTQASMARGMRAALDPSAAALRTRRLADLVGTGGADRAAREVLRVIDEKVRRVGGASSNGSGQAGAGEVTRPVTVAGVVRRR